MTGCYFYSHVPRGTWQKRINKRVTRKIFLLTRPSRDVTVSYIADTISKCISTHTSLAGRDFYRSIIYYSDWRFLLTRPSRDVTIDATDAKNKANDFYSHVPRGTWPQERRENSMLRAISTHTSLAGRDGLSCAWKRRTQISTHTSLAGRDFALIFHHQYMYQHFYSHVPRGTWLPSILHLLVFVQISTHTSLAGRDIFIIIIILC